MPPQKPEMPIAQLRQTSPQAYELLSTIVSGLVQKHWKDPTLRNLGFGLEATIEGFEELIDAGLMKVDYDEERGAFWFSVWDDGLDDYKKLGT